MTKTDFLEGILALRRILWREELIPHKFGTLARQYLMRLKIQHVFITPWHSTVIWPVPRAATREWASPWLVGAELRAEGVLA